jgi:hypothetical protein
VRAHRARGRECEFYACFLVPKLWTLATNSYSRTLQTVRSRKCPILRTRARSCSRIDCTCPMTSASCYSTRLVARSLRYLRSFARAGRSANASPRARAQLLAANAETRHQERLENFLSALSALAALCFPGVFQKHTKAGESAQSIKATFDTIHCIRQSYLSLHLHCGNHIDNAGACIVQAHKGSDTGSEMTEQLNCRYLTCCLSAAHGYRNCGITNTAWNSSGAPCTPFAKNASHRAR